MYMDILYMNTYLHLVACSCSCFASELYLPWTLKVHVIQIYINIFYSSFFFPALRLLPCSVKIAKLIQKSSCDVLCIIDRQVPPELVEQFGEFRSFDKAFDSVVSCFKSPKLDLPIVYSPVQELTDYHDVRTYQKAAAKSLERAIKVR